MTERCGRTRPYRVVFTDAPYGGATTGRRGTLARGNLEEARREALNIARSGKAAEVHYVTAAGEREIMAVYTPDDVDAGDDKTVEELCDALLIDAFLGSPSAALRDRTRRRRHQSRPSR